jgi:hypothetical protein
MNIMRPFLCLHRCHILSLAASLALLICACAQAQTISNPSFEADTFTAFPGYISDNSAITGWTATRPDRAGINPAVISPFADNGAIPAGSQVAFIQNASDSTLSTVITGLTPGTTYNVMFRANARGGNRPMLRILIDGGTIVDTEVDAVGGANPYKYVAFNFTATNASQTMTLKNDASGDNTVLVDDFRITEWSGGFSAAPWSDNASSGVDSSYNYTHAYNFGSAANALVNGVIFTGAGGANPSVSGRFSTAGFGGVFNNDGNNVTDAGASRTLANDFVYGGPLHTITINGLVPGREYIATIFGVGWDDMPVTRASTFSSGTNFLTVNVNHYGNNSGVRVSCRYTADGSGTAVINYQNLRDTSFHTYAFCNRETTPRASWGYSSWTSDASSGISAVYTYTHAYNLGSGSSPTVNGVSFTGVPDGNPTVGGQFSVAGVPNTFTGDGGAGVSGAGGAIASDFIYGGNPGTLTVNNLTPGAQYLLTLYTSAWDPPGNRFIEFSAGSDRRTIDQDVFGNAPRTGVLITYAYTADPSGTLVVQTRPYIGGNSMHLYGFSNRGLSPTPLAPVITLQPVGIAVAQGLNVTLRCEGYGEPSPSYQWLSNGVAITDQTNITLVLAPAVAGDYQCVLSNSSASVTSVVATVKVGLPMTNPSFEVDSFPNFPGYVSGNGPITGWASLPNHGVNTAAGPFADNGTIPHGTQVALMQGAGALSQTVSGFTPGNDYYVEFYENARNCCGGTAGLTLTVSDGVTPLTIVPTHSVTAVGAGNPYVRVISYGFPASAASLTLTFTKSDAVPGDSTALIDNVCILPLPPGTAPVILIPPQNTLANFGGSASFSAVVSGSSPRSFQWRKDGADISGATSAVLTLNNLSLADDANYSLIVSNSAGSATSVVAHLTVNLLPVAGTNTAATLVNTPLTIAHAKLLYNDSDPDNDPLTVTAVSATSVNGGSVVLGVSNVTYTPLLDFTGPDSFTYTISDGRGGSATTNVHVVVAAGGSQNISSVVHDSGAGTVTVTFAGIPGYTYRVQYTTELTPPVTWSDFSTNTVPPGGLFQITDTVGGTTNRYYRTVFP